MAVRRKLTGYWRCAIRLGAFELREPVPTLDRPRLLLALAPWVDVGTVGSMTLAHLEREWGGLELGRLARPGDFYDFTRYRPIISGRDEERSVTLPNTVIRYSRGHGDWLTLHVMEPHARGEDFRDSIVALMRQFGVVEYVMVGAMYGPVAHTRPATLSGGSTDAAMRERLRQIGVRSSVYEGPTTILATIPEETRDLEVVTASMLVQLPAYAQLEADYRGRHALLDGLIRLYGLPIDAEPLRAEGDAQYRVFDEGVARNPQLRGWVHELEAAYDREMGAPPAEEPDDSDALSPELQRFLGEMQQRLEGRDR